MLYYEKVDWYSTKASYFYNSQMMRFGSLGRFVEAYYDRLVNMKMYLEPGRLSYSFDIETSDFVFSSTCGRTIKSIKICHD